ncbi:MAG: VOC family protein, partial [Bauldia litoralis]
MKYLHTMVRVRDLDASLKFYRDLLGLKETRRIDNDKGRFTLVFLAPEGQEEAPVELT